MKPKTYAPIRIYSSTRRYAEQFAAMLTDHDGEKVTMIQAIDVALHEAITTFPDNADYFGQDFPGYDHAPSN